MMQRNERSRPVKAAPVNSTPIKIKFDSTSSANYRQSFAAQVDHALAVVVKTSAGRARRRLFLTLASAERHADKAREAGHDAEVVLVALQPVQIDAAVMAGWLV